MGWQEKPKSQATEAEILEALFQGRGVLLACFDRELRCLWANQAYADAFGGVPEGQPDHGCLGLCRSEAVAALLRRAVETGQPCAGQSLGLTPSSPSQTATWWDCTVSPAVGSSGQVEGLVAAFVDVADRVRLEDEPLSALSALETAVGERTSLLSRLNDRLQREVADRRKAEDRISQVAREWTATFDAIRDFVSVQDRDFRIVRANRALADFVGLAPRDVIGKKCHKLIHGTDEPWPECPHVKALETMGTVSAEIQDPRVGIPLLVTCSPFFDGTGTLVGSVHVARDISGQKKAEEEREKLIGELQQALSTVRLLSGLLPICSGCKKIRDDKGKWSPIEGYIQAHSEAEFTHGICPECAERLYPDFVR